MQLENEGKKKTPAGWRQKISRRKAIRFRPLGMQFEYLYSETRQELLQDYLNDLGLDRWELIGYHRPLPEKDKNRYALMLKREAILAERKALAEAEASEPVKPFMEAEPDDETKRILGIE